jgi:hypothetical protein
VAARTFKDSTGNVWEVFEVRRSSQTAQAVSPGLERGWLAFVCGPTKRRLAPFPDGWQTADVAELERLCRRARGARASSDPGDGAPRSETEGIARAPRSGVPRIRSPRGLDLTAAGELPIAATATSADPVESTVRTFALQARSRRLPAIEAMVQLKGLLARVYTDATSAARDLRSVRRWFVDSYYFDRDASRSEPTDQSR